MPILRRIHPKKRRSRPGVTPVVILEQSGAKPQATSPRTKPLSRGDPRLTWICTQDVFRVAPLRPRRGALLIRHCQGPYFFSGSVMPHLGQGPGVSRVPPSMEQTYFFWPAGVDIPSDDEFEQPTTANAKTTAVRNDAIHLMANLLF